MLFGKVPTYIKLIYLGKVVVAANKTTTIFGGKTLNKLGNDLPGGQNFEPSTIIICDPRLAV